MSPLWQTCVGLIMKILQFFKKIFLSFHSKNLKIKWCRELHTICNTILMGAMIVVTRQHSSLVGLFARLKKTISTNFIDFLGTVINYYYWLSLTFFSNKKKGYFFFVSFL